MTQVFDLNSNEKIVVLIDEGGNASSYLHRGGKQIAERDLTEADCARLKEYETKALTERSKRPKA